MTGLPDFSRQRMLAGVCLHLATKLGWSVWGFRAAALLALWINPLITGVVYLAGGWWINRERSPGSDRSGTGSESGERANATSRRPVVIDQKPRRVEEPSQQAEDTPEIHAHSERVEELLERYRALDEQLKRRA